MLYLRLFGVRDILTTRGPATRSAIGVKRISNYKEKKDVERERREKDLVLSVTKVL